MHRTKYSFLVCIHNEEEKIARCIDSCLGQSVPPAEIVVVNDASSDNSVQIVNGLKDRAASLNVDLNLINLDSQVGLTKALNIGLKSVTLDWIARIDADDICLQNRMEEQILAVNKTSAKICFSGYLLKRESSCSSVYLEASDWDPGLFRRNRFAHSSAFFEKDLVLRYGGYNEYFRNRQDYALWMVLRSKGVIPAIVSAPLVIIDRTSSRITSRLDALIVGGALRLYFGAGMPIGEYGEIDKLSFAECAGRKKVAIEAVVYRFFDDKNFRLAVQQIKTYGVSVSVFIVVIFVFKLSIPLGSMLLNFIYGSEEL